MEKEVWEGRDGEREGGREEGMGERGMEGGEKWKEWQLSQDRGGGEGKRICHSLRVVKSHTRQMASTHCSISSLVLATR